MGSFPMKVSFVWPFPRSSKMVTSYAPSMASCSIPSCAGSILFPFESEKYIKETIFSCGTISWYSTAFQNSCPSGELMQQRNFPPTRKSILQTGAVKPFGPHHCITHFGSTHPIPSVRRTRHHSRQRPVGGHGIGTFYRCARQKWRAVRRRGHQIRHLVLHAERERRPIVDDQRCSPCIGAQYIGELAVGVNRG